MTRPGTPALLAALLLAAAPCGAVADSLSLADFEAGLSQRGEYRLAQAEVAVADAVTRREAGNAGLRATGAVAGGALYEPQYLGGTRDYGSVSLSAGLRYPILGSAAEERLRVATARLDALVAESRRDAERLRELRQLRESFFTHAHARALVALSEAFLADAWRIREVLRRRQAAGLIVEADRRRLEGAFALAERHRLAAREELRVRGDELKRWRPDFEGEVRPPPPAALRVAASGDLAEVLARRAEGGAARLATLDLSLPPLAVGARGSLFLTGTVRRDSDLGNGGAVLAGLSLDLPVGRGALGGLSEERDARVERTRLALDQARDDERAAVQAALADQERNEAGWRFARVRVASSGEALLEAARRANIARGADGAPIERWLDARAVHYEALVALLDAERQQQLSTSLLELALGGPGGGGGPAIERVALPQCREAAQSLLAWRTLEVGVPAGPPPCADGERAPAVPRAFYAWSGTHAVERAAAAGFWAATGASELWLSFTGEELRGLRKPAARSALGAAVADLQRRGHRVALLLGEPTWLLPGGEEKLFAILRELSDVPFEAVHLDLEPGQLAPAAQQQAWPALARLVRRAREVGGKPVILSVNWRDLRPDPRGTCRGCDAARAADEVAVMLYATSPAVVAERMGAILAGRPARRVWLAQSIEATGGADESFARRGRAALDEQFIHLSRLARDSSFAGFAVQSLEDFLEATP